MLYLKITGEIGRKKKLKMGTIFGSYNLGFFAL